MTTTSLLLLVVLVVCDALVSRAPLQQRITRLHSVKVAAPPPETIVVTKKKTSIAPLAQQQQPPLALQRLASLAEKTVWTEFGALAASLPDAKNLGQGYPDWSPPQFAVDAYREVAEGPSSTHQYARSAGLPKLCEVLGRRYSTHFERPIDAMREVAVCVGATQALLVSLMSVIQKAGDKVVVLEPCFDLYFGQIRLAGGVPKACKLKYDEEKRDFSIDFDALEKSLRGSRVLIVNSPQNPTGKVFSENDLRRIAILVAQENSERRKRNLGEDELIVISDEVYKYIVLDNDEANHVHFAKFPGVQNNTLTVSSAGKTFSATGWQIGWLVGPTHLVAHAHRILPYLQFCASTPMQAALAVALDEAEKPYLGFPTYYAWLREEYARKRQILKDGLLAANLKPLRATGGFFLLADVQDYLDVIPAKYFEPSPAKAAPVTPDWAFSRWIAHDFGVVAIPASPFFSTSSDSFRFEDDVDLSDRLVRFAFCKADAVLHEAADRLRSLPHPSTK